MPVSQMVGVALCRAHQPESSAPLFHAWHPFARASGCGLSRGHLTLSQRSDRMASRLATLLVLGQFLLLRAQLSEQGAGLLPLYYLIGAGVTSRLSATLVGLDISGFLIAP